MNLQEFLTALNTNVFFKEFSFSKNEYAPEGSTSLELADHLVWIDDIMLVFQLKERDTAAAVSAESERKWFDKKVLGKGTKQIRDTLRYLSTHDAIVIRNQKGHSFDLSHKTITRIGKIVMYSASELLPEACSMQLCHVSATAGLIHIMPVQIYLAVCRTLVTPADIIDYLQFRERKLNGASVSFSAVTEKALVGQFLSGNEEAMPDNSYSEYVDELDNSTDQFDLSELFFSYGDRITYTKSGQGETDYYQIIAEFAKLKRSGLREAKTRIKLCFEACQRDEFRQPYRFYYPETGCGFVFIPLQNEFRSVRLTGLQNLAHAAKYDQKVDKQIAVSFAKNGEYFLIDWCFLQYAWKFDSDMEERLKENNPFRTVKEHPIERFRFKQ